MADCGASGSALDRTARALLSGSGGAAAGREAAKQVASVMGHALAGHHDPIGAVRPLAAPDHIVLPSSVATSATATAATRPNDGTMIQPQGVTAAEASPQLAMQQQQYPWSTMRPPPPAAASFQQYQQQQQQHPIHLAPHLQMAAAAQQHHQMIVLQQQQQQMQFMIQQQQHLQQQQEQQQQQASKQQQQQQSLDQWHEGLDQQFRDELREHYLESLPQDQQQQQQHDDVGHEGIVHGATMEELAAAWEEAQADYERNVVEETTNLWSGGAEQQQQQQGELSVYEFINQKDKVIAGTTTTTTTTTATTSSSEHSNWMEEGMREFRAGNLKEAIRAFEMELQCNNADSATAWRMLGQCHAENDMDQQAILCLEQAVDRDPYSPEALLALGVSYVNELNHNRALDNLKAWITHNPTFAGLELDDDVYGATAAVAATAADGPNTYESPMESAFDDVQRLLLRALDYAPSDAADVLEALGVVYNVSRDYTAAADAFRRAIDLRPDDYQLWNKLGATLANGSKSEEALPAYHKALQLKPKYARAWLNMAISHSNLQNYDEAARCYLQTISLNPTAVHCWSYLRIALSCSERWDLIPIVAAQDLKAFQEHFDFVLY